MEKGDVVFAKKVTELYKNAEGEIVREDEYGSKERGARYITLLLGVLRAKAELPTSDEMTLMLASVGYIGTNDITEVLGEAATTKLLKHIEKTYKVHPNRQNKQ